MHDPLRSSASTPAKRLWMRMRVLDGANDLRTRVVRVMARRCLIGTDDTCNLRVAGPAVRGVHCLLIRGTRHIVIRSWSPDTLLNGREFSEAVLSAGDRVAVGASEFEVLDAGASTTVDETEQILELLDEPGASLRQIALGEWRSLDRLREAVDLNRARVRRLLEHIQSQQQERHRKIPTRDARRPEPASEERAEEIFDAEPEQPASTSDRGLDECPPAHQVSELHFQEVSTEAPVTANELLNRLRFEPSADEQRGEEPLACPPCCQAEESTARAATDDGTGQPGSRTSVREQTSGEEDESMDACIARFMERLSSTPARAQPSYLVPNSAGNPTDQSLAKRQAESPPAVAAAEIDRAALLTALPQRSSTAPGRMANLSAMRELAQQQAQFALDVHFRAHSCAPA